ncbi:hypothetical protein ACJX0J_031231, partial [Zea mays]
TADTIFKKNRIGEEEVDVFAEDRGGFSNFSSFFFVQEQSFLKGWVGVGTHHNISFDLFEVLAKSKFYFGQGSTKFFLSPLHIISINFLRPSLKAFLFFSSLLSFGHIGNMRFTIFHTTIFLIDPNHDFIPFLVLKWLKEG